MPRDEVMEAELSATRSTLASLYQSDQLNSDTIDAVLRHFADSIRAPAASPFARAVAAELAARRRTKPPIETLPDAYMRVMDAVILVADRIWCARRARRWNATRLAHYCIYLAAEAQGIAEDLDIVPDEPAATAEDTRDG